jgi:hypothetical protein
MDSVWADMRNEFQELQAPGKLWHKEIQIISARKIKRLVGVPPAIFGLTEWNKEDLTQIVISERIIGRNQGHYIYEVASTIDDARRLLATELNFTLEDLRVPNQVDNVWKNLEGKLIALGWSPPGSSETVLDQGSLVKLILNLKRLKNKGVERLSPLFSSGVLDEFAKELMDIDPNLPKSGLISALREALTIISPALSIENVGTSSEDYLLASSTGDQRQGETNEDSLSNQLYAHEICANLDSEQREILFQLACKASHSEIASILGVSRPTAVKRIEEFTIQLSKQFDNLGVEESEKLAVFRGILDLLGAGIEEGRLIR